MPEIGQISSKHPFGRELTVHDLDVIGEAGTPQALGLASILKRR
jgi:hypothetical protein